VKHGSHLFGDSRGAFPSASACRQNFGAFTLGAAATQPRYVPQMKFLETSWLRDHATLRNKLLPHRATLDDSNLG